MAIQDWLRERNKAVRISAKEQAWLERHFPHLARTRNAAALRDLVNLRRALRQTMQPRAQPAWREAEPERP